MKWQTKILIVFGLAITVAAVLTWKGRDCCPTCPPDTPETAPPGSSSQPAAADSKPAAPLPRLVELGANWCMPCRRMKPVLEQLRREYAGRMEVEFVNVEENRRLAKTHGVRVIPTQIFISADGKELYRHEGYISKEDILLRWSMLGVTFAP